MTTYTLEELGRYQGDIVMRLSINKDPQRELYNLVTGEAYIERYICDDDWYLVKWRNGSVESQTGRLFRESLERDRAWDRGEL